MPAFSKFLPTTDVGKNSSIRWSPSRFIAGAGHLTIRAARCVAEYLVVPIETDFVGHAFMLAKVSQGSDPDEANYTVFIAGLGEHDSCTCKGHTYRPHQMNGCKHIAAMKAVLRNCEARSRGPHSSSSPRRDLSQACAQRPSGKPSPGSKPPLTTETP